MSSTVRASNILALVMALALNWAMACSAYAQESAMWEIVMKDGATMKGYVARVDLKGLVTIVEHGGNIRLVSGAEIARMKRLGRQAMSRPEKRAHTAARTYWPDSTGIMTQVLINLDYAQAGVGASVGYRFNPWLQLRGGFRAEITGTSVGFVPSRHNGRRGYQAGVYFPLFAQIGGHVPKLKAAPFYDLELGYAFRAAAFDEETPWHPVGLGGYHLAATVGVRIFTRNRYNLSLGLRMAFRGMEMTFQEYGHDYDTGLLTLERNVRNVSSMFLGLSIMHTIGR